MSYLIKEIFRLAFILLVTSFLTFFLLHSSPGSAAESILVSNDIIPTQEAIDGIKKEYGLDKPFMVQYLDWLKGVVSGDLGFAYSVDKPVAEEFLNKLPYTLMLAGFSITLIILISFPLGILSATYRGRVVNFLVTILTSISISIPSFWMGLMLIIVFVVNLGWFQITKMGEPRNIVLAAIALALPLIGRYTALIRGIVTEQLSSDYITGAIARGVTKKNIIINHLLPSSIVSTLPLIGISIGAILGGTVIIENIFSIPGLGNMVINAIYARDYPLIKSFVLFMTVVYIFISFSIDQICKVIDPRLRA